MNSWINDDGKSRTLSVSQFSLPLLYQLSGTVAKFVVPVQNGNVMPLVQRAGKELLPIFFLLTHHGAFYLQLSMVSLSIGILAGRLHCPCILGGMHPPLLLCVPVASHSLTLREWPLLGGGVRAGGNEPRAACDLRLQVLSA